MLQQISTSARYRWSFLALWSFKWTIASTISERVEPCNSRLVPNITYESGPMDSGGHRSTLMFVIENVILSNLLCHMGLESWLLFHFSQILGICLLLIKL